jgi:4'-phosphopantetheinyl transferase
MKTQQLTYEDARILVFTQNETTDELITLLTNFNDYEKEFLTIKSEKRKREFLAVRIAMNILTGKNVIIYYNENQKPFLSDHSYHISISHSRDFVAVIAHPAHVVGIDIEGRNTKVSKVYQRFLNEDEQTFFCRESDSSLLEIAWSAKETLYKIIGKEVHDFARHLHIYPLILNESGDIRATYITKLKIFYLQYIQNDQFTLVYCIDKN